MPSKSINQTKRRKKKARWEPHKNATGCCKILEAVPHETAVLRDCFAPLKKNIPVRRTRPAGHCRKSNDELISDFLFSNRTDRRASVGREARTYLYSSVRTLNIVWCMCQERWMIGKDGERNSRKSMLSVQLNYELINLLINNYIYN